mgnify:FL=1
MIERLLKITQEDPDAGALIRTWRQERAFRVGRALVVVAFVLGAIAMIVELHLSDRLIVYGDIIFLTGCFLSIALTRSKDPSRYFLWWPAYIGFWISSLLQLFVSGGLRSPFLGLFMTLYFLAALIVQTEIKPAYIGGFVFLNLTGWTVLEYFQLIPKPEPMSFIFMVSLLAILGLSTIACALVFFKTEKELARQVVQSSKILQETKARLGREEAANLAKREFLADAGHELREALGAILGFADLAGAKASKPNDRDEYVEIIRRNAKQMARLVDDLLDISKIESGKIEIQNAAFRPYDLFHDVIKLWDLTAKKKGVEVQYEEITPIPEWLKSDPLRIQQIVSSLLHNALKLVELGTLQVLAEYERDPRQAKNGKLRVSIVDTGHDLGPGREPMVKPLMGWAREGLGRQDESLGRGLHLARKLAALLGGELVLLSGGKGAGCVFSFVCPVSEATAIEKELASSGGAGSWRDLERLDGLRALIADDSADQRKLIRTYLEAAGASVSSAQDGLEAIQMALSQGFDIVIADAQLSLFDGLSVAKVLRQKGFRRPVVALAADGTDDVVKQFLALGYDSCISKPINRTALVSTVSSLVKRDLTGSPYGGWFGTA